MAFYHKLTIKNRKEISAARQRLLIYIFLILVLFSVSIGYTRTEKPEQVYYFNYAQMTDVLENLTYQERIDEYTVNQSGAALTLDLGNTGKNWKYLYLNYQGQNTLWDLQIINETGEILSDQEIELVKGKNRITLNQQSFQKLRFVVSGETGSSFRLENVRLCQEKQVFSKKRFCLYTGLAFLGMTAVLLLLFRWVTLESCEKALHVFSENINEFLNVLGETISWHFTKKIKRLFRVCIFVIILLYITCIQIKGVDNLVSYALMHVWITGGLLLILAGLCNEKKNIETDKDWLKYILILFVFCVMLSDFFVNKKFRYAGFGMLFMGGLFCRAWQHMEHPEELIDEFKLSYKIYFALGICFCLVFRPVTAGVCYNGFFIDAASFGIASLAAAVIFGDDLLKSRGPVINGSGLIVSLYLVWSTQKMSVILIAMVVMGTGVLFGICRFIRKGSVSREKRLFPVIAGLAVGIAVTFCVRKLLYVLPYKLGQQHTFDMDVTEMIDVNIRTALGTCGWKRYFLDKLNVCKVYLQNINLLGNKYLLKVHGVRQWPSNSVVMNFFRYGIAAGISYAVLTAGYFIKGIKKGIRCLDFFAIGVVLVSVSGNMLEVTELPFGHLNWFLFYFGVCSLLGSRAEKD